MTKPKEFPLPGATARRVVCSRCGTEFGCGLSKNCWCAEETAKLPMPTGAEDCLCRECLRKAAGAAS
ncbi:cysteine-rich CWC family protein [Bradyrhizobium arachidis]|uniref:cysteine-rich CWC family protein n=1 Tax=Bradyrhizobium arachidis TaxID=858423 RepID=UPI0021625B87|nr:cysteine-rich CWC family protein [Bradyrhizobium arachidis]